MSEKRATIRLDVDVKRGQRELKGLTGDFKNTKDTTKEATQGVGNFNSAIGMVSPRLQAMISRLTGATNSVRAMTASTKALRVALLATGIGAIVIALGTLIKAFTSTQEGSDRLQRVLQPLSAIFSALFGEIQKLSIFLADTLVEAIRNPGEAFAALANLIRRQVQVRVQGLIDSFGALGRVIGNVVTGNFKEAGDAALDYGRSMAQLVTGQEDAIGSAIEFGKGLRQTASEAAGVGAEIQELNERIRRLRIEQEVPLARQRREYQELRNVVRDTTLSEEERLEAADRALELRRNIRDEEMRLVSLEIERLELKQSLNDTSDEELLKLEQLRARQEEIAASAEREAGRVLSQRASIVNSIEDQAEKEREAAEQRRLEQERRQALVGSILEQEEKLAEAQQRFIEAVTDADREAARERIQLIEDRISALKGEGDVIEENTEKTKRGNIESAAGARNLADARRGVLRSLFDEIILQAILSAVKSLPFPLNIGAAGGAAGLARGVVSSAIPGFADGVRNFKGGLAVVGEEGPELVDLPPGSDVFSNQESQDIQMSTANDFRRALQDAKLEVQHVRRGADTVETVRLVLKQERALGADGTL